MLTFLKYTLTVMCLTVSIFGCQRYRSRAEIEESRRCDSINAYYELQKDSLDSIFRVEIQVIRLYVDSFYLLKDSVAKLNKHPLMTSEQFIKVYKYDRLYKYYKICNNNPSQWKYYKGWSIRVFSE